MQDLMVEKWSVVSVNTPEPIGKLEIHAEG
jgi:hypothetical protein